MYSFGVLSLLSPLLPIGGFTYSQGIESAVENNLITDTNSLKLWIESMLYKGIKYLELPILIRLCNSAKENDWDAFLKWGEMIIASRGTMELKMEEMQKGRALVNILPSLNIAMDSIPPRILPNLSSSWLQALAYAAVRLDISVEELLHTFIFSFVESMVTVGAKIIPLGQSACWSVISEILTSSKISTMIAEAKLLADDEIGSGLCNMAIQSSLHEVMYSRIYRN